MDSSFEVPYKEAEIEVDTVELQHAVVAHLVYVTAQVFNYSDRMGDMVAVKIDGTSVKYTVATVETSMSGPVTVILREFVESDDGSYDIIVIDASNDTYDIRQWVYRWTIDAEPLLRYFD